mgnify:CR=1 FL=1
MENKGKMRLIVIDFTAFNMAGERQFITDYADDNGEGQHITRNKDAQEAVDFLKSICHTVMIHSIIEYDLEIISKKETIVTPKYQIPINLHDTKKNVSENH